MIRKIILENFMSHARTEIELAEGLTVLTGPNNCGKSAVVAALHILATNGKTTHVLRHGASQCSVTVETDDDHTVTWRRNGRTAWYCINGEDIHRVGMSIPDALHDVLRLDRVTAEGGSARNDYDIHFGEQKSPVFLLGDSGSRAASFFASSSDASRLVAMQQLHKKRHNDTKAKASLLREELAAHDRRLKAFEPLDDIASRVTRAESVSRELTKCQERTRCLAVLMERLNQQRRMCQRLQTISTILKQLEQANTNPTEIERAQQRCELLSRSLEQRNRLQAQVQDRGAEVESLRSLAPPPEMRPAKILEVLLRRLDALTLQQRQSATRLRQVEKLQPPPRLHDTQLIELLQDKLERCIQTRQAAHGRHQRVASLVVPPKLKATDDLANTIESLVRVEARFALWNRQTHVLRQVATPIEPIDCQPLRVIIAKLQTKMSEVGTINEQVHAAHDRLTECANRIHEYVALNPRCSTCGSRIDPETLISATPGSHSHDGTSVSSTTCDDGEAASW